MSDERRPPPPPGIPALHPTPVTVEIYKARIGYRGTATGSWYPCPPGWWRPTLRGATRRGRRFMARYRQRKSRGAQPPVDVIQ